MTIDQPQKIEILKLQNEAQTQFGKNLLHVLNGQRMYDLFAQQQLFRDGCYVPFNEAMCSHETTVSIFSSAFQEVRAKGHHVSLSSYEATVLTPLKPFLTNEHDGIVLWFGDDMFCQINALTVLAYLDQSAYTGDVLFYVLNDRTYEVVETLSLQPLGFADIYRSVLLEHTFPTAKLPPFMQEGIRLYLHFIADNNELTDEIQRLSNLDDAQLLQHLLQTFPQYGLGDVQYQQLIRQIRRR
ncbi:AraC family transcriptional regulator [Aureibacillus halotolerans]|uniref:AraC family transcriptional regulator n=1 Tax=Aureibacillus halotolerans TaxID=1508390 RepID=A0A4R6TX41_9BACI|nr:AraC family transcriptional regulator [Aureibacillus halotolerans]TDQ36579.1 hypothetical protein EV213_11743 [Aureibacillus halotolerans]